MLHALPPSSRKTREEHLRHSSGDFRPACSLSRVPCQANTRFRAQALLGPLHFDGPCLAADACRERIGTLHLWCTTANCNLKYHVSSKSASLKMDRRLQRDITTAAAIVLGAAAMGFIVYKICGRCYMSPFNHFAASQEPHTFLSRENLRLCAEGPIRCPGTLSKAPYEDNASPQHPWP